MLSTRSCKINSFIKIFLIFITTLVLCFFIKTAYIPPFVIDITEGAASKAVDKALIVSVIKCESGFNKNAVSDKSACGLMQLKRETFYYVCDLYGLNEKDIFSADSNVSAGACYLEYLINKFGTLNEALCAYNAGEGTVLRWLDDRDYSANGKTLDRIPYKETRDYLAKVKFYYCLYKGFLL